MADAEAVLEVEGGELPDGEVQVEAICAEPVDLVVEVAIAAAGCT